MNTRLDFPAGAAAADGGGRGRADDRARPRRHLARARRETGALSARRVALLRSAAEASEIAVAPAHGAGLRTIIEPALDLCQYLRPRNHPLALCGGGLWLWVRSPAGRCGRRSAQCRPTSMSVCGSICSASTTTWRPGLALTGIVAYVFAQSGFYAQVARDAADLADHAGAARLRHGDELRHPADAGEHRCSCCSGCSPGSWGCRWPRYSWCSPAPASRACSSSPPARSRR